MIYVTADTHFGHKKILEYNNRPFISIEDMDRCIINNINEKVKPNDILWHLGDFSFGKQEHYRKLIKCRTVNLLRGNHDFQASQKRLRELFNSVNDIYVLKDDLGTFVMCHYSFFVWPHKHHGAFNLYGHSHGKLDNPDPMSMDIGVDTNGYKPYALSEVKEILRKRLN